MKLTLEQWTQRFVKCFAPLEKQSNRVILYTTISCLKRFPATPIATIQQVVKDSWQHYMVEKAVSSH